MIFNLFRDRFILIYSPSKSKEYCTVEKARRIVSSSMFFLLIVNSHLLFGYERIYISEVKSNDFYDCNIRKDNDLYRYLFRFYDSYVESILFVILPFIIMSFCSLLIILQLLETRKNIRYNSQGRFYYFTFSTSETIRQTVTKTLNEQRRTRLRDKDIQLCSMLIGTTLAFLFLCLPTEINDIFNYQGHERSCNNWLRKVLLTLMQQIYYAGHLYIYTLTGQLFRKHLFIFLCPTRTRSNLDNSDGTNTHESFSMRILSNFTSRYDSLHPYVNSRHFITNNFVKTEIHRPMIIQHRLTNIQSDETHTLHDPSQRLLTN